jgi:predicted  nucleic acid-binding Zn-ribbon protein
MPALGMAFQFYSLSSLKAAEMERRRRRAREAAQRIMKKIRSLAKTTASLRRRHRKLREFVANSADTSNSFAVYYTRRN